MTIAESFFHKDGMVPGTLLALIPGNKLICCQRPFANSEEKTLTFNHYAVILFVKKSTMYSFISEMWFAREEKTKGPFRLPAHRSDRKEGLMIATRDNNGNSLFKTLEIIRTDKEINLIEIDYHSGEHCDHMNLYARVEPNRMTKRELEAAGEHFDTIGKPEWYSEIDLEDIQ